MQSKKIIVIEYIRKENIFLPKLILCSLLCRDKLERCQIYIRKLDCPNNYANLLINHSFSYRVVNE